MSRLVLYRAVASPPVRSVMMLGDILGLQFEYRDVNLLKGEHFTPEYRKLNPMGRVPVLQEGDFILSESHAILKYLVSKYGGEHRERLYPSDARTRALVDQGLFFNCGHFFPKFSVVALPMLLNGTGVTPLQLRDIDEAVGALEAYLQVRRYVAADHLTIADLSVGASATAANVVHKLDSDKFPRTVNWINRLEEETFFKTINAEGLAYLKKIIKSAVEKNKMKTEN